MTEQNFGYRQELNRSMSGFSSFAVSFSLISVLTGIFANFNFGFREIGGFILFSWTIVAVGQWLIAKVMAALAVRFPIAGYGYQWSSRLLNPHFGFFIGWMLLIQFMTGFPGIAQTAAIAIVSLLKINPNEQIIVGLTILIIFLVTWVHIRGIRFAARVNDLGVYAELFGVAILIGFLTWAAFRFLPDGIMQLTSGVNYATGTQPDFSSWARSLLLGAWCLTGFEAAADLAEETIKPEKTVPKAVVQSLVGAAVIGFLIIALMIIVAGDIHAAQKDPNTLFFILESSLGKTFSAIIMVFVIISILACAVASMATASRLLFSMSRDHMLPFSEWLARVNTRTKTPQTATLVVFGFSCLAVLLFRKIELITSVSALAAFIGYAGIMYASMREKVRLISILAFVWSLIVVAAIAIPEIEITGVAIKHLPAVSALVVILFGGILYLLFVRRRILLGKAGPPVNSKN
jgi:amino acid transporter